MKRLFCLFYICGLQFSFSQEKNTQKKISNDSVVDIETVSITQKIPITKEIISVEKDLKSKNLGQDLPILLKNQISVESTSDTGHGVGYTGIRIRGVDATRININLNGVPYNDSESQGSFFVNIPDVVSSASHIVIQRGVGTSNNGTASFGASMNIISRNPSDEFYFSTQNSLGTFSTYKNSFELGTGKILGEKLSFVGRYSTINSDGYRDRAFSKLNSYNFVGFYGSNQTKIRFQSFGGKEKTYQAWNGISKEQLELNPKYNPSGEIYNQSSQLIGFYDNETDNYSQNHYHLSLNRNIQKDWNLKNTLHYTRGFGYYENYESNIELEGYQIFITEKSNLIKRKYLDNHFFGIVSQLNANLESWNLDFGVSANSYLGNHYGRVIRIFSPELTDLNLEYYKNKSKKNEFSTYLKILYKIENFEFFADLQFRVISYQTHTLKPHIEEAPNFNKKYNFISPKTGFNYNLNNGKIYFSYASIEREPTRYDLLENIDAKQEKLQDFELGYNANFGDFSISANCYYMFYKNQLVLTGALNDVGSPIHQNVGKSYRTGLELYLEYKFSEKIATTINSTIGQNKNRNYMLRISDIETKNLGNTTIAFSPNFTGNFSLNYKPTDNLNLFLTGKLVGKQYLDNTQNATSKLSDYNVSDFSATYTLKTKELPIDFYFLINNIFNQKHINNGNIYEGKAYYFPQAGINFLIGVSMEFK